MSVFKRGCSAHIIIKKEQEAIIVYNFISQVELAGMYYSLSVVQLKSTSRCAIRKQSNLTVMGQVKETVLKFWLVCSKHHLPDVPCWLAVSCSCSSNLQASTLSCITRQR